MNTTKSYPLAWPNGWPREKFQRSSSFGVHSMQDACDEIFRQLKLLDVGNWEVIISTNVELRQDGLPYSNRRQPADTGAAVYFTLKRRPVVLACNRWGRVEDNLWAIAKDIEAQRGRIRWGVGSVEQAFAGYAALPPPAPAPSREWFAVLGFTAAPQTLEVAKEAYRRLSLTAHPDRGGTHEAMSALNSAWAIAQQKLT